jgi:hypothetical protein
MEKEVSAVDRLVPKSMARPLTTRWGQRVPPSFFPAVQIQVFDSFHIRKIDISGHSGAQTIVVARQTNLDSEHLSDPVGDGLHVARGKLCLSIDLLDDAVEILARK